MVGFLSLYLELTSGGDQEIIIIVILLIQIGSNGVVIISGGCGTLSNYIIHVETIG